MHICVCAFVSYVHHMLAGASRGWKRESELKLWVVLSHPVGAAKQTQVLCKSGHSIAERGRERD